MEKKRTETWPPQDLHTEALAALEQARACPRVRREARR
jgi:hypothetical protein